MTIRDSRGENRRGFVLVAVLVVVMLASMVAVSLIFRIRAEQAGAAAGRAAEQAWAAAWSGVQQALYMAEEGREEPEMWRNNPGAFRHQLVVDDGADRWHYSVYSEPDPETEGVRYGLSDESARLNLNVATGGMLGTAMSWPAHLQRVVTGESAASAEVTGATGTTVATEATATSEMGATNTTGSTGAVATASTVLSLPQLHARRFATMEELLILSGFTQGLVYGEDANRNFTLDPNEDDGDETFPPDDGDGQLLLGAQALVTVYSYELNRTPEGGERIRLNSRATEWEIPGLSEEAEAFIHKFQASDILLDHPVELFGLKLKVTDELGVEQEVESPLTLGDLALVIDWFGTESERRLEGRINVNTAPEAVLRALPGLDESKARAIIEGRQNLTAGMLKSPVWLLEEGILEPEEFKAIAPWVTTRSLQFRFHVIGYGVPSGRHRILEVVIDVAENHPRVLYVRDITRLGLPFGLPMESNVSNETETDFEI